MASVASPSRRIVAPLATDAMEALDDHPCARDASIMPGETKSATLAPSSRWMVSYPLSIGVFDSTSRYMTSRSSKSSGWPCTMV